MVLRRDADAVVRESENAPVSLDGTGDVEAQRAVRMAVLEGIVDQIGKHLAQHSGVGETRRERARGHFGPGLPGLEAHGGKALADKSVRIHRLGIERRAPKAGEFKQPLEQRIHILRTGADEAHRVRHLGGDGIHRFTRGRASVRRIPQQIANDFRLLANDRREPLHVDQRRAQIVGGGMDERFKIADFHLQFLRQQAQAFGGRFLRRDIGADSEELRRAGIPCLDNAVQIPADNGIAGRLDDRCELGPVSGTQPELLLIGFEFGGARGHAAYEFRLGVAEFLVLHLQFDLMHLEFMHQFLDLRRRHAGDIRRAGPHGGLRPGTQAGARLLSVDIGLRHGPGFWWRVVWP